jgi:hypothetical protein
MRSAMRLLDKAKKRSKLRHDSVRKRFHILGQRVNQIRHLSPKGHIRMTTKRETTRLPDKNNA